MIIGLLLDYGVIRRPAGTRNVWVMDPGVAPAALRPGLPLANLHPLCQSGLFQNLYVDLILRPVRAVFSAACALINYYVSVRAVFFKTCTLI